MMATHCMCVCWLIGQPSRNDGYSLHVCVWWLIGQPSRNDGYTLHVCMLVDRTAVKE